MTTNRQTVLDIVPSGLGGLAVPGESQKEARMDVVVLAARVFLVYVFLSSALVGHLGPGYQMLTGFATGRGLPAPGALVRISGVWSLVSGVLVLLGIWGDLGALMLAGFVAATALLMHPFWKETDEQAKTMESIQFSKDIGLAGGALVLFVLFAYAGTDLGLTITGPLFEL